MEEGVLSSARRRRAPAHRRPSRAARRGRVRGAAKPAAAICLGLAVYFAASVETDPLLPTALSSRSPPWARAGDLTFAVSRDNYPVPSSLAYYPWDHVAEPHERLLSLCTGTPHGRHSSDGASPARAVVFSGEGWAVRYNFTLWLASTT